MAQSLSDKCEAIKSLLPYVNVHLSLMDGNVKLVQYGQAEQIPAGPPPPWVFDCMAHCPICPWKDQCRGEPWESLMAGLRWRYRIEDIEAGLRHLDSIAHFLAHAIVAVYVDPYDPASEPVREAAKDLREQYADAGVRFIAWNMNGDVDGYYCESAPPTLEEQTEGLMNEGITSPKELAQRLGCSYRHAKRLRRAVVVRSQQHLSAVSELTKGDMVEYLDARVL